MNNKAIYPGTFDPLTNGHLDLVTRAARIFDHIVLAVATNPSKRPLFDVHERIAFAVQATKHLPNVTVIGFSDLVSNLACQQKTRILIRGVRAISDLEYEMQLAQLNRYLMKELETILMIPSESWSYISSTLVKEIALHGGNVNRFIPASIVEQFLLKLHSNT